MRCGTPAVRLALEPKREPYRLDPFKPEYKLLECNNSVWGWSILKTKIYVTGESGVHLDLSPNAAFLSGMPETPQKNQKTKQHFDP